MTLADSTILHNSNKSRKKGLIYVLSWRLYLEVSWLHWPYCVGHYKSAGCVFERCWLRAFPVLGTENLCCHHHSHTHTWRIAMIAITQSTESCFEWRLLKSALTKVNSEATQHTCHHAVGGLLVAIVTWRHGVVQAGWGIAQGRSGQMHVRALGRLDQGQARGNCGEEHRTHVILSALSNRQNYKKNDRCAPGILGT